MIADLVEQITLTVFQELFYVGWFTDQGLRSLDGSDADGQAAYGDFGQALEGLCQGCHFVSFRYGAVRYDLQQFLLFVLQGTVVVEIFVVQGPEIYAEITMADMCRIVRSSQGIQHGSQINAAFCGVLTGRACGGKLHVMSIAGYAYGYEYGVQVYAGHSPGIFDIGHTALYHIDRGLAVEQGVRCAIGDFVYGSHGIHRQFSIGWYDQGA